MLPLESEMPAYVAPNVEHLLGDLGGIRTDLESRGIYLRLSATAEFAGNVSRGAKQGATSAHQVPSRPMSIGSVLLASRACRRILS